MKIKKGIAWTLGIVIALIIVIGLMTDAIVDYQWFNEVGYLKVFFTSVKWKAIAFIPCFAAFFLIIHAYINYIKTMTLKAKRLTVVRSEDVRLKKIINLVSLGLSFVLSLFFTGFFWYRILEFVNASDFGVKDPLFHKDASFYIFRLPLIQSLLGVFIAVIVILAIISIIAFGIAAGIDAERSFRTFVRVKDNMAGTILAKQLAILGTLFFVLLSAFFYIKTFTLVYAGGGVVDGAGYTEVNITLPMYKVICVCCLAAAVVAAISIRRRKVKPLFIIAVAIIVIIIGEGVISEIVERAVVTPNARDKESKYISYNIEMTRKAFGLDDVKSLEFPVDNSLTAQDIENNKSTVDNIRITEFGLSKDVYNQMQAIRTYYVFNDVDIDRYMINGRLRQVFIAARELDLTSGDARLQTWQNTHLFYTHGYGAVMSYTNQASSTGLPEYILDDIPVQESANISLDTPQMYFGEMDYDYVVVGNKSNEIDYPTGNDNKESRYDGKAGIRLTPFNRLIYAWKFKSPNLILSSDISSSSRIIMYRNIRDRVEKIAPFLSYDEDPYVVVANDRMYWIIDAYTYTDRYPYSEDYNGINYISNSVKVVVDAYDGTVDFYLADKNDGIAKTMNKIYGGIFKDINDMPEELRSHLRYSEDVFEIQAQVYEKYHMTNVNTFYNGQDLWSIATYKDSIGNISEVKAVYQVMKLPGEDKEEFILSIPYTVAGKENMVSWLAVRMDSELGSMLAVNFPEDQGIYGPQQFESKINTNTEISQSMSLWGQQGSEVLLGETSIIPIENSLLYVKSLYLKASGQNSLPELKRVIVQYGDTIVMEPSIDKAMDALFNSGPADQEDTGQGGTGESTELDQNTRGLIKKASELFDKAKQAQMSGDWAAYGEYLNELEQVLGTLEESLD